MSAPDEANKPAGDVSSSEFFESIGRQAEKVDDGADAVAVEDGGANEGDDQKVVEEIESLCMNCGENVRIILEKPAR